MQRNFAIASSLLQGISYGLQLLASCNISILLFACVLTPPQLFKEHVQYLHNNYYKVITAKDLLQYIDVEKALNEIEPNFQKK